MMVGTAHERLCPREREHRRAHGQRIREQHMAFKNFKIETDADGIALVTWDMPGRSMNVLDETRSTNSTRSSSRLGRRRRQGRGHHLGQGGVLRRRRPVDARRHEPHLCRDAEEPRARKPPTRCCSTRAAASRWCSARIETSRQAVGRRDQRAGARRRFRTDAGVPLSRRRRKSARPGSACPKSRSACSPAPAAPSACRASCRRRMRCRCCSRARRSTSTRPRR